MHASLQELISYRDREPVPADVAQHIAHCETCGTELVRLRQVRDDLQRLPSVEAPAANWMTLQQRIQDRATLKRSRVALSIAASALLAAVLAWRLMHFESPAASRQLVSQNTVVIEPLVQRSQQLESLLHSLPARPSVEHAATAMAIDELQARIQMLDQQLNFAQEAGLNAAQVARLWSDRVQLLNSLVDVRYAEASANGNGSDLLSGAI